MTQYTPITARDRGVRGLLFSLIMAALLLPFSASAQEQLIYANDTFYPVNPNTLRLDEDDSGGDVILQFGKTLSERILWDDALGSFRITDDLEVQGTLSGASLTVSDLKSCDTIDTDANGNLTCGTDGGGINQADADERYVNQSGDTMTGNLIVGNAATLSVSGAIITEGNLTINEDNTAADAVLTFGNDALAETLRFSDTTEQFEFSDDVHVTNNLTASGTLTVEGAAIFESTITLNGITYTFPSTGGLLNQFLTTNADGTLSYKDIDDIPLLGDAIASGDEVLVYDVSTGGHRKVTRDNFLSGVLGALVFQGTWDASTNTPTLSNATGSKGQYYVTSTGGTVNFGSGAVTFREFDYVIYNGDVWEKLENVDRVVSVFGRQGAVTAQANDYSGAYITFNNTTSGLSATDVQAAIDEIDTTLDSQQSANDARYVNQSGDTMTGNLVIGNSAGLSASGTIATEGNLTASGTFSVESTSSLQGNTAITGTLDVTSNVSASGTLSVESTASIQGAVTVGGNLESAGTISGASLTISGLLNCDTIDTDANGNLACGTDQDTQFSGTGALQSAFDNRYVNLSGDTMTGNLVMGNAATLSVSGAIITEGNITINEDNSAADAILTFGNDALAETLRFSDTTNRFEFSDDVHVTNNLTASGTLTIDGAATFRSTIALNGVTYTFPGADGSASGKVLATDSAGQLSWTDAQDPGSLTQSTADERYVNQSGDTMTGNLVIANGAGLSASGVIATEGNITASGTLSVEGNAIFQSNVTLNGVSYAFPGSDGTASGNVLLTDSTGQLSWGLVSSGSLALRTKEIHLTMNDVTFLMDGTDNSVNVFASRDTGANPHQFYAVKSGSGQLNDVDLVMKVRLPKDFVDFSATNDISFFYRNTGTNATDSKTDILVEDDDGDDAFTAGDGQGLFNTSWAEYTDEFDGGSFDPAAGEYIFVTAKGYASTDGSTEQNAFIGEIVLTYIAR